MSPDASASPDVAPFSSPADPGRTGGRRVGVLLSHGFTGSPFSMRPWAQHLADQGYAVELPRLPGHGTTWREMNKTRWADWYAEVGQAFDRLYAANDAVVVGGLSMGGALVLRLAADRPDDIAGVMLVNPAVNTVRKDVLALPVLKWIVPAFPAIANDIKKPGVDEHAYPKTPLKAAHSMMQAWKPLRADLGRITAPVLYFRSVEDHVVDPSSGRIILEGSSRATPPSGCSRTSYHVATIDNDAETIFSESVEFIERVTAAG